ncbi:flagellar biosynthesis protein FlhB [Algisphaera agarilytica]|uniref:Flagellar biosynthetic protein FlhB n=1 Tax=Algisphaera agarilytica TaxID=1385975 RepID=A0A7X0LKS8_9BACT|nr:flagellar biosynthesis protein FlhB [Algisphaera agarilytica]MBB6430755.1 flagellar biosynthetic protein FlhB [Algisphaera agarilytica]
MAETGQDKTEQATPRRKTEARNDGNLAKSQDLTAAVMLLAAIIGLQVFGLRVFSNMRHTVETLLTGAHTSNPARIDDLGAISAYSMRALIAMLAPLLLIVTAAGLVAVVGQVGFLVTGKPLVPDPKKLNPIKGIQQMFSARSAVRLVMSIGKFILIGAVAGYVIYRDMEKILHLAELSSVQAFIVSARMVFELAMILAALLIVLALLDYWYQKWQHNKDLMMTKEQVKQEMKDMDGDPMVKQRRARVARQLAMQRMAQAVPNADVIVTNPTHYAIALKYDKNENQAPKVIAKGADFMAMRIRQIAALNGIPLVERKPLARALYAGVEVGEEIPQEHYAAVAEILAYVYRLSGNKVA